MRIALLIGSLVTLASCASSSAEDVETAEAMLTHAVFFELENDDPASVQALIDGCYEYLAPHNGIVYFSAGARHVEYQREVNDLGFDVALTIVFENTAAQEAYQVTEPHLQFIDEFNENWASVRVFDSLVPPASE